MGLVCSVYAPSLRYGFIYDDHPLVTRQASPQSAGDILRVFAERHWRDLPYYRPVARASLLLQKWIHGDDPAFFHAFNVLALAVLALLVRSLFRSPVFGASPSAAWLGAAIFAAHPIASSCAYPVSSGRETLLPGVFMLGAVLAHLRAGVAWRAVELSMLGLALLSKEMAIVTPGLLLLADLVGFSEGGRPRGVSGWARRYAGVGAVVGGYGLVRAWLFGGGGEHALAVFEKPWGPPFSYLYALLSVFAPPVELVYEPEVSVWTSAASGFGWRLLGSFLAVCALGFLSWRAWETLRKAVLFSVGWFLLSLAPTANFLEQEARFDERYALVALAGAVGAFVAIFSHYAGKLRLGVFAVAGAVLLACASVSVGRGRFFRDDFSFHRQWVRTNPRSPEGQCGLGAALVERGEPAEALVHLRRALEIEPDFVEAHYSLGSALGLLGRYEEAERHLRRAVEIRPDSPEARFDLAGILEAQGRRAEAISELRETVRIAPRFAPARVNLGLALAKEGRLEEAVEQLEKAVALEPRSATTRANLALVLSKQSRWEEAARQLERAVELDPGLAEAHHGLGAAWLALGRPEEAIREFREALRLRPGFPEASKGLEAALAAARLVERGRAIEDSSMPPPRLPEATDHQ